MTTPTKTQHPVSASMPTTARQDTVTGLLGIWLLIGLFVDGWAHTNLEELETFFTPWHALFYSGFAAGASWMVWLTIRRLAPDRSFRQAIPPGYELGMLGLLVFSAGGVADMLWHTVFGIETTFRALLSPPHLVLFTGGILAITSPIRAVAHRHPGRRISPADAVAATLSLLLLTGAIAFFMLYAWGPTSDAVKIAYDESPGAAVFGTLEILITTLVLLGPATYAIRRFELPPGSFTLAMGGTGVLMAGIVAFDRPWEVIAPFAAGMVLDGFGARKGLGPTSIGPTRLAFALAPIAMWTVHMSLGAVTGTIGWPVEVWTGAIFFSGLLGVGLSLIAFPGGPATDQVNSR